MNNKTLERIEIFAFIATTLFLMSKLFSPYGQDYSWWIIFSPLIIYTICIISLVVIGTIFNIYLQVKKREDANQKLENLKYVNKD